MHDSLVMRCVAFFHLLALSLITTPAMAGGGPSPSDVFWIAAFGGEFPIPTRYFVADRALDSSTDLVLQSPSKATIKANGLSGLSESSIGTIYVGKYSEPIVEVEDSVYSIEDLQQYQCFGLGIHWARLRMSGSERSSTRTIITDGQEYVAIHDGDPDLWKRLLRGYQRLNDVPPACDEAFFR